MSDSPLKSHGRAILETAKDHLIAVLVDAPDEGWTAAEWAAAAGLLLDGAGFPAVVAHHLAPILVQEGRASSVGDGVLARFCLQQVDREESSAAVAKAMAAPAVGPSPALPGTDEESFDREGVEAVDGAAAADKGPWSP
ncbi:MAG: hypothetical protein VX498_05190 [Myxococcota bacterium]|nr:hypothetical protein [Myxococcota bacterium]